MTIKKIFLFAGILAVLVGGISFARSSVYAAKDLDNLEVSLAIIGPADALYSWWGHVAIIMENTETGAARYYDYGNFSFSQDSFIQNFIMGRLYFLKMASDPKRQLKYNTYLNRDVTVYSLNVSPENKLKLLQFLENDILPENRIYLYDHFYDNCSTRIRDEMDIITDGQFSKTYSNHSDKTLRMQLRRFTYSRPFMDWLLNFAMNGTIDKPATEYAGMYLPLELERGVVSMMISDGAENMVPFVKNVTIVNRAEGRAEIKAYPPPRWPFGLAVGVLLAVIAWWLNRNLKAVGVYGMILSFVLAVPGSLLFFMACFTDHSFAYRNMNLLFVNPFLFVVFAVSIRLFGNPAGRIKTFRICWTVIAAGALLAVILKVIPFCRQANWETILIVLPVAVVLGPWDRIKHIKRQNAVTS